MKTLLALLLLMVSASAADKALIFSRNIDVGGVEYLINYHYTTNATAHGARNHYPAEIKVRTFIAGDASKRGYVIVGRPFIGELALVGACKNDIPTNHVLKALELAKTRP